MRHRRPSICATVYTMQQQRADGGFGMVIAVACDGLAIAPAFVMASSYMCYDIDAGSPARCRNIPAADQPLDRFPQFLASLGAEILVTGIIDADVKDYLEGCGIEVIDGRSGDPLDAVEEILDE